MSACVLAIDCGNSSLKWGAHADGAWQQKDSVPLGRIAALERTWGGLSQPCRIVVSNVAGEAVAREIAKLLARWKIEPVLVRAKSSECGVTNGYAYPERLGSDRWAALIGARALHRGPVLVVDAGTATTADMLTAAGEFSGGVILPGIELMKRSLAQHAAQLPLATGRYLEQPRDTVDAIETGCLLAQAGAIERLYSQMEAGAHCLITGGGAGRVAAALRIPVRVVDNLVLEGLLRIAG